MAAGQPAHFLDSPVQAGRRRRIQVEQQARQQDVAAQNALGSKFIGAQFRRLVDCAVEVGKVDAALLEIGAEGFRRLVTVIAGGRLRRCQGFPEMQMLEAVQGVVMHEILDRRLRRQDVLKVMNQFMQPVVRGSCIHDANTSAYRPTVAAIRSSMGAG